VRQLTATPVDVDSALDALAAYGLTGTRLALPAELLRDDAWPRFVASVATERLAGLLGAAIADGVWPVTDDQRAGAGALQTDVAAGALLLERLLLTVVERFAAAGVATRVLKGSAVAHLDFPDPAWRSFGDLDLLIDGADLEPAIATLTGAGGERDVPELRPGFDRRFGKGATVVMPGDLEVDLHRTLLTGPLGLTIPPEDLFATHESFELGGRTLDALGTEERFVHACVHTALSSEVPRHAWRDVAQLASSPRLDVGRVADLGRAWRAGAAIASAVRTAWTTFALPDAEIVTWARAYRPDAADRRVLDAYLAGDRSYTRRAVATLRAIPGGRDKVAFARSIVFPAREYLDAVRVRRFQHVRRGTSHLRIRGAR
jgi:hypothetical protein